MIKKITYIALNISSVILKCLLSDGKWSSWTTWASCSEVCGGGIRSRVRACSNPPPSNGGQYCSGGNSDFGSCNNQPCLYGKISNYN